MEAQIELNQNQSNSQILKIQKQMDSLKKSISDNEPLIFSAHGKTNKSNEEIKKGQIITYTDFLANVGWGSRNCFNLTTGEFDVPKSAVYEFTFYGFAIDCSQIEVYKNDENEAKLIFRNNSRRTSHSSFGQTWHMELNHGDKIHLKIDVQKTTNYNCEGKAVHLDKDKDYIFSVKLVH